MGLFKLWIEKCEAARGIEDEFGSVKAILGRADGRFCAEYFICMFRKCRRPDEESHDAMETRLVATATPTEGAPSCR
jgi:hypothetical protein